MLIGSSFVSAQAPEGVIEIAAQPNTTTTFKGNLNTGEKMESLRWASYSFNACFPGTQNSKFRGNHVLHYFDIPAYSELEIKLIPKDKKSNFRLYGYQVGTTNFKTSPELPSCVSCEADHKWDYPKRGKTQDHTRSVKLNAINNPYRVVIGVV